MEKGITTDPDVALSGLIAVALLSVLLIGGGLTVDGLLSGSWLQVVAGVGYLVGFSWLAWEAGKVVRNALKQSAANESSGA